MSGVGALALKRRVVITEPYFNLLSELLHADWVIEGDSHNLAITFRFQTIKLVKHKCVIDIPFTFDDDRTRESIISFNCTLFVNTLRTVGVVLDWHLTRACLTQFYFQAMVELMELVEVK